MSDTVVAPIPSEGTPELSLEQQLEALKSPTLDAGETPPDTAPPGVVPDPAASPAQGEGGDPSTELEAALEKIAIDKPVETKDGLTPAQQQVLATVPTPEIAQTLHAYAESYHNFTTAFEKGNFAGVDQMFKAWNPQAYDAFLEHVYTQKVESGEWVDRWITNTENPVNKPINALRKEIDALKNQLTQRSEGESQAQVQARAAQTATAYRGYVDGLFDQIDFSPADRRWVADALHNKVATDPTLFKAVSNGQFNAVNGLFAQVVREYVNRDKAANATKQAAFAKQAAKVAPIPGSSPVAQVGALPDDIKQVPKGKEDEWMDQEFAKLAKKRR